MSKPHKPIRIRRTAAGWHFVVKANNSQILVTSETYEEKDSAVGGINALAGVFLQNHPTVEALTDTIRDWFQAITEEKGGSYADLAQYILDHHHSVQDDLYKFIQAEKPAK